MTAPVAPVAAGTATSAATITIRSRWNYDRILYSGSHATIREAVTTALKSANLRGADLHGAELSGADLSGADLCGADLCDADLCDANLGDANLGDVKADLISEVLRLPNELEALRDALLNGKVDGSTYSGECACLAGTLAKARGIEHYNGELIKVGPVTFHASSHSLREQWFMAICIGDTPDKSQVAAIALDWVNEAIAIRDNIRAGAAS